MALKLGSSGTDLRVGSSTPATVRLGSSHIWSPPMAIPGLYAWYDFADSSTMTLNGGNISQIADKSGNGKAMAQAAAAAQPALTTNALNGRSAATFTGTQWLQAATAADWKFLHYGSEKSMIFTVVKGSGDWQDNYGILGTVHTGYNATGFYYAWFGGDSTTGGSTITPYGNANWAETNTPEMFTSPIATCMIGDPSANAPDRLLMASNSDRNAEEMAYADNDNDPQNANPTSVLTLGRAGTDASPFLALFEGIICEVLIYKRSTAFTSGERAKAFDYLAARWGIT